MKTIIIILTLCLISCVVDTPLTPGTNYILNETTTLQVEYIGAWQGDIAFNNVISNYTGTNNFNMVFTNYSGVLDMSIQKQDITSIPLTVKIIDTIYYAEGQVNNETIIKDTTISPNGIATINIGK